MALIESKKGGPYAKQQREKRRNEVFRLHFELGHSARKISEMLNVNRNTINSDLNFAYSQLSSEWTHGNFYSLFMKQLYRLEIQRRRLLEELKKQNESKEKLAIEKMVLEIDTRIFNFYEKFSVSSETMLEWVIHTANSLVKNDPLKQSGFVNMRNVRKTLDKTRDKINKLIEEDDKKQVGKIGL